MKKFDFSKEAEQYDNYYSSPFGMEVDRIEKAAISQLIKEIPIGKILEIGCGTGHWTQFFVEHGFSVHGIDLSSAMLQKAIEKSIPHAKFEQMDFLNNTFKDASQKHVFAITSLEFTENQDRLFEEIYRILEPGGYFLAGCLNSESEMGQQKDANETFAAADFFTWENLNKRLSRFGEPKIIPAVLLKSGQIMDEQNKDKEQMKKEACFFATLVRKTL